VVSVCNVISVQQQASGWLETLYVHEEIVLHAHTIVRVHLSCVCLVIHTYTTTLVTLQIEDGIVPRISVIFLS